VNRILLFLRQNIFSAVVVTLGLGQSACAQADRTETYPSFDGMTETLPEAPIGFSLALEVLAEVGEAYSIEEGPNGARRIVPIIGGSFRGSGLTGVVLPGGADRQTVRADGVRELDAIYELRADDGSIIMVHNRAIVDAVEPPDGQDRYVKSVVTLTVPKGRHDWLNRRLIIGTLHSMRPEKPLVLLRFYVVE